MKKLNVVILALLFTQNVLADGVKNQVSANISTLKVGDAVFVKPQYVIADSAFTTAEQIASRNQLEQYEKSKANMELSNTAAPRPTTIRMTHSDYESTLRQFAITNKLDVSTHETKIKAAAKLYQMRGIRPVREGQVLVTLPQTFETIYNINDLGLTKEVNSELFKINDTVLFAVKVNGNNVFQSGSVAAILATGELIVQKGLTTAKVQPQDLFSAVRTYENQRFKLNEEVTYKYSRPGSFQTIDEAAKVVGISPNGDIVIHFKKLNQLIRIASQNISSNPEATTPGIVTKVATSCAKLFAN